MSSIPTYPPRVGRIFNLIAPRHTINGRDMQFPGAIVLTPEPTADETVVVAWTYALRYSAKGLDMPDYDAALALLLQRHPSWQIVDRRAHGINPDLSKDIEDTPET
jgi:hypothetical protein